VDAKRSGRLRAPVFGRSLQPVGELDREIDAFAQLAGRLRAGVLCLAHLLEGFQQPFETAGHQLLAERGIAAGAFEILFGNKFAYEIGLIGNKMGS
jgi:hypothetical protein